jgi:hypothetical protein
MQPQAGQLPFVLVNHHPSNHLHFNMQLQVGQLFFIGTRLSAQGTAIG